MGGGATMFLTVTNTGVATAHDTMGCSYNGTVTQVMPNKNLFNISLASTGCGAPSTFTGLGALLDVAGGINNAFTVALDDGTSGGALQFQ